MPNSTYNLNLGLSDYAITAYLTLVKHHPVNGSQLSRLAGIPRARIYDLLRKLKQRGMVTELRQGMFLPLPPKELIRQLRRQYEADIRAFEQMLNAIEDVPDYDFVYTLSGYANVMAKAREMINAARQEIYIRQFPAEGKKLDRSLQQAEHRGVEVKYIAMRPSPPVCRHQVVHPDSESMEITLGGRSFDLIVDRREFLGGLFQTDREDRSAIHWGKNKWFVTAGRDSLRHDFFHYFLHKLQQRKQPLSEHEKRLYDLIDKDV